VKEKAFCYLRRQLVGKGKVCSTSDNSNAVPFEQGMMPLHELIKVAALLLEQAIFGDTGMINNHTQLFEAVFVDKKLDWCYCVVGAGRTFCLKVSWEIKAHAGETTARVTTSAPLLVSVGITIQHSCINC